MKLILLDAHAIIHRAYHALPDFSTSRGEPTGALYGISTMLIKLYEDQKPDYMVACYDLPGPTYRHEAYKEYKLGRKPLEDALVAQLQSSRRVFEAFNIPIYDKPGFEADDIIGTICEQIIKGSVGMTSVSNADGQRRSGGHSHTDQIDVVIASGDMDTMQLIHGEQVKVFTMRKGIKDTVTYDEKGVFKRFGFGPQLIPDYKGLRGDPSDNIIGVKGIGEKTATILISTFGTIENIYQELQAGHDEAFVKAGITPRIIQLLRDNKEEAEFSKMLATIRRDVPIKFVLPEKTFEQNVDVAQVKKLWQELEFRTLGARLEQVLKGEVKKSSEKSSIARGRGVGTSGSSADGQRGTRGSEAVASAADHSSQTDLFNNLDQTEVLKAGLALWLINSNLTNPQLEDILEFAGTRDFAEAKKIIMAELEKKGLQKVFETIEEPLIPIVRKMGERGIKVDRTMLENLGKTYHTELSKLEKSIWKEAGMEFNINSPKQLGEVLFDKLGLTGKNMKKTSGGARSTRESELEKLRDSHPIVPMIFEYRELSKLLSTYIDAIPPELDDNNRLHTTFILSGSTTGRMASQDPNLQNIPIKTDLGKAIRRAFVAEKGYKLVSFDYSQMELRIGAFLSGDEKLIEIFRKGEDVHTSVASFVFKVPASEVTSEMRRQAKVINFGIIYGMGVLALKQNLGSTREEAQKFLNEYFETFKTLADYLNKVKAETARRNYTETFFGRRRQFEGINSKIPYIRAQAERMAINAPIQGTGADLVKISLIRIDEYLSKNGLADKVFPLLQVHDELIYEIKEDVVDQVAPEIEKIMESIIDPKETHGVVMKADYKVGNDWGELK